MNRMVAIVLLLIGGSAQAEVKTREVDYQQGETALQGFIAWDDALKDKRPGVVVIHEWWGHNQHARDQALRLAKAGYVGFALDPFGKGKLAKHPKDAQAFVAEATKDPKVTQARFAAAVEQLKHDPHVDPTQIAAVGYCFGGAVALDKVKARILVNAGAADTMVPPEAVEAFKKK